MTTGAAGRSCPRLACEADALAAGVGASRLTTGSATSLVWGWASASPAGGAAGGATTPGWAGAAAPTDNLEARHVKAPKARPPTASAAPTPVKNARFLWIGGSDFRTMEMFEPFDGTRS